MIEVRIGDRELQLSWEEFEARVRDGRIPPDALVRADALTGQAFVQAQELESYRSLRNVDALAWRASFGWGPPPVATALLAGIQLRIWWLAHAPTFGDWVLLNLTNWTAPALEDREVWRPLTMGLVHVEATHILANMLWFLYTGWNLEVALGWRNLVTIFFASVLGGSLLSMLGAPQTPSLGASGGIFGMIAASMIFGFVKPELLPERGRRYFGWAMLPYLVLMFWSGLLNEGTDNWSHLGGLLTGGLLAFFLDPEPIQRRPQWNRSARAAIAGLGASVLVALALAGPRAYLLVDSARALQTARGATPPMTDSRSSALRWSVPRGWKPAFTATSAPGFASPAPKTHRRWSVVARMHESGPRTAEAARADWLRALQRAYPEAAVGPLEATTVAGWPGFRVVATTSPAREHLVVWSLAQRGLWELQEQWEVETADADSLDPLHKRLVAAVYWEDPDALVAARERNAASPGAREPRRALAKALAEVGEVDDAIALWRGLIDTPAVSAADWNGLLQVLQWFPQGTPDTEALLDGALAANPDPEQVVEVVAVLDAMGRARDGDGLLDLAWRMWPKHRALRRARAARGLWVGDIDPGTLLPSTLVLDPLTGEALSAPPSPALSLAAAASAGAAREALLDALVQSAHQAADPLPALAWLLTGRPVPTEPVALAELTHELLALDERSPLHGSPRAILSALTPAVRAKLQQMDGAAAPP